MENKHKSLFKKFEKGKLSLDEYLTKVVFFKERSFTKKNFIEFMFSQSLAIDSTLDVLDKLSSKKRYELATINNESRELNNYRISKFNLARYFRCFFSSCYVGARKPDSEIFYKALQILHKNPDECLYIDDREENYNSAERSGLNSILLKEPGSLRSKLEEYNIEI
jgi:putative hydrolase of the HAD superfamily